MQEFTVPTHEIETPIGKHKVVLKDFINGYDDEAVQRIYTRGRHAMKANAATEDQTVEIDGAIIQDAIREMVSRVVVSVNGVAGNENTSIVDLVYSLRVEHSKFIQNAADLVFNPEDDTPAKKTSGK